MLVRDKFVRDEAGGLLDIFPEEITCRATSGDDFLAVSSAFPYLNHGTLE